MTKEDMERCIREVAEKSKHTQKIPSDLQRTIRIGRYESGTLRSCYGTLEEATKVLKLFEEDYGPLEHIE